MAKPDTWMPLKIEPWTKKTARLSLAERGAYMDLLLAYWVGGPLPADDEDTLKRMARCTDKEWKQVRVKVLSFFTRDGDVLRQGRADEELADAAARYERRASAGRSGGLAKAKQPPKQNPSNATAEPQASYKEHSSRDETEAKASGERKRSAPKAGTRTSPDWKPNERNLEDAKARGYHAADIERLAQHFRDYHLAKGTVSKDWDASWRTWLANDAKFSAQRGNGVNGQQSRHNRPEPGSIVDLANRLKARAALGGQNHRDGGMGRGGEWVQTSGDERDEMGVGFGAGGIVIEADECGGNYRSVDRTETPNEGQGGTGEGPGGAASFVR